MNSKPSSIAELPNFAQRVEKQKAEIAELKAIHTILTGENARYYRELVICNKGIRRLRKKLDRADHAYKQMVEIKEHVSKTNIINKHVALPAFPDKLMAPDLIQALTMQGKESLVWNNTARDFVGLIRSEAIDRI